MNDNKILSLFLNSICMLCQVMYGRAETTGAYFDIKKSDYKDMFVPDLNKLSSRGKQILLTLFKKLRNVEFTRTLINYLLEQGILEELDRAILKILGFSSKEIEEWLPRIYDMLVEELKGMKEVK